jgi:DNA polymerase III epsilon subunit-like protein
LSDNTVWGDFAAPKLNMFSSFSFSSRSTISLIILRSIFLEVPYLEKDVVKRLGAKWNHEYKKWSIPSDYLQNKRQIQPFLPWIRDYLHVPYHEKDKIKKLGGIWDHKRKQWYIKGIEIDQERRKEYKQWKIIYLSVEKDEKEDVLQLGAYEDTQKQLYIPMNLSDKSRFLKWIPRKYLVNVPIEETENIKQLGAFWDETIQNWYIISGQEDQFEKYLPVTTSTPNFPSQTPSGENQPTSFRSSLRTISEPCTLLFFDVETTGLPTFPSSARSIDSSQLSPYSSRYPHITDLSSYNSSRIVQISSLLCSYPSWTEISRQDILVKCTDFEISNSEIHGITTERSREEGIPFPEAISLFLSQCSQSTYFLAHNLPFDSHIIQSELYRHQLHSSLSFFQSCVYDQVSYSPLSPFEKPKEGPRGICTMNLTKKYLLDTHGKTASLKNLYEMVMDEGIANHHNAMGDVESLWKVMKVMIEKDLVRFI